MNPVLYILCLILLPIFIGYIVASLLFVKKLKKQLQHADLEKFKSMLNANYQFRYLFNGLVRYKWYKKFAVIKADFTQDGTLETLEVLPLNIFKYLMKTFFYAKNKKK